MVHKSLEYVQLILEFTILLPASCSQWFMNWSCLVCWSDRIQAHHDMCLAVELYKHSVSTLRTLELASREEQCDYVAAWYSMFLSCTQELQHGAVLWQESCHAKVCDQVISEGIYLNNEWYCIIWVTDRRSTINLVLCWLYRCSLLHCSWGDLQSCTNLAFVLAVFQALGSCGSRNVY
jgi:hypothetical protein